MARLAVADGKVLGRGSGADELPPSATPARGAHSAAWRDELAPETMLAEVQRAWPSGGRRSDRRGGAADGRTRWRGDDLVLGVSLGAGTRSDGPRSDRRAPQRAARSGVGAAPSLRRRRTSSGYGSCRRTDDFAAFCRQNRQRRGAVSTGHCAILLYTNSLTPRRAAARRGTGALQRHRRIVGERRRRRSGR